MWRSQIDLRQGPRRGLQGEPAGTPSSKWTMCAACQHPHADHRRMNIRALLEKAQQQLHFLHVLRRNRVDMKLLDSGGPAVLLAGCVGPRKRICCPLGDTSGQSSPEP